MFCLLLFLSCCVDAFLYILFVARSSCWMPTIDGPIHFEHLHFIQDKFNLINFMLSYCSPVISLFRYIFVLAQWWICCVIRFYFPRITLIQMSFQSFIVFFSLFFLNSVLSTAFETSKCLFNTRKNYSNMKLSYKLTKHYRDWVWYVFFCW